MGWRPGHQPSRVPCAFLPGVNVVKVCRPGAFAQRHKYLATSKHSSKHTGDLGWLKVRWMTCSSTIYTDPLSSKGAISNSPQGMFKLSKQFSPKAMQRKLLKITILGWPMGVNYSNPHDQTSNDPHPTHGKPMGPMAPWPHSRTRSSCRPWRCCRGWTGCHGTHPVLVGRTKCSAFCRARRSAATSNWENQRRNQRRRFSGWKTSNFKIKQYTCEIHTKLRPGQTNSWNCHHFHFFGVASATSIKINYIRIWVCLKIGYIPKQIAI